jgi:hypothetical protein
MPAHSIARKLVVNLARLLREDLNLKAAESTEQAHATLAYSPGASTSITLLQWVYSTDAVYQHAMQGRISGNGGGAGGNANPDYAVWSIFRLSRDRVVSSPARRLMMG